MLLNMGIKVECRGTKGILGGRLGERTRLESDLSTAETSKRKCFLPG